MIPHNSEIVSTLWNPGNHSPSIHTASYSQTMPGSSMDKLPLLKPGWLLLKPKQYLLSDIFQIPQVRNQHLLHTHVTSVFLWQLCEAPGTTAFAFTWCLHYCELWDSTCERVSVWVRERVCVCVCVCVWWGWQERRETVRNLDIRAHPNGTTLWCLIQHRCIEFTGEMNKTCPFLCLSFAHANSHLTEITTSS